MNILKHREHKRKQYTIFHFAPSDKDEVVRNSFFSFTVYTEYHDTFKRRQINH